MYNGEEETYTKAKGGGELPSGKTHQAVGGTLGILYAVLFHQPISVVFSAIIGALLPDIDHKHSKIGRYTFICLILIPIPYALAFAIGYTSHLFLDSLTPQGINLWKGVKRR